MSGKPSLRYVAWWTAFPNMPDHFDSQDQHSHRGFDTLKTCCKLLLHLHYMVIGEFRAFLGLLLKNNVIQTATFL